LFWVVLILELPDEEEGAVVEVEGVSWVDGPPLIDSMLLTVVVLMSGEINVDVEETVESEIAKLEELAEPVDEMVVVSPAPEDIDDVVEV
jgi:hypothetical protein